MFNKEFWLSTLGRNWKRRLSLWIIFGMILIIVPNAIFYKKIIFNPASFTQDWVKTIINIFFLYLILEYQKFSSESNRHRKYFWDNMRVHVIDPLHDIINELTKENIDTVLLKTSWARLYRSILTIDIKSTQYFKVDKALYNIKDDIRLPFINSYISTIDANALAIKSDYKKCLQNLTILLETFEKSSEI